MGNRNWCLKILTSGKFNALNWLKSFNARFWSLYLMLVSESIFEFLNSILKHKISVGQNLHLPSSLHSMCRCRGILSPLCSSEKYFKLFKTVQNSSGIYFRQMFPSMDDGRLAKMLLNHMKHAPNFMFQCLQNLRPHGDTTHQRSTDTHSSADTHKHVLFKIIRTQYLLAWLFHRRLHFTGTWTPPSKWCRAILHRSSFLFINCQTNEWNENESSERDKQEKK